MTAIGYGLWNSLLRRHQVSAVAPFLLLMPVFSMAGAVFFLGEAPTANVLLGGLIVLVGGDHIARTAGPVAFGRTGNQLILRGGKDRRQIMRAAARRASC